MPVMGRSTDEIVRLMVRGGEGGRGREEEGGEGGGGRRREGKEGEGGKRGEVNKEEINECSAHIHMYA